MKKSSLQPKVKDSLLISAVPNNNCFFFSYDAMHFNNSQTQTHLRAHRMCRNWYQGFFMFFLFFNHSLSHTMWLNILSSITWSQTPAKATHTDGFKRFPHRFRLNPNSYDTSTAVNRFLWFVNMSQITLKAILHTYDDNNNNKNEWKRYVRWRLKYGHLQRKLKFVAWFSIENERFQQIMI